MLRDPPLWGRRRRGESGGRKLGGWRGALVGLEALMGLGGQLWCWGGSCGAVGCCGAGGSLCHACPVSRVRVPHTRVRSHVSPHPVGGSTGWSGLGVLYWSRTGAVLGAVLVPYWCYTGAVLVLYWELYWCHIGAILEPYWCRTGCCIGCCTGAILELYWCGTGAVLGVVEVPYWCSVGRRTGAILEL